MASTSQTGDSDARGAAARSGGPAFLTIERAVECHRRQCMLEETNAAFAATRAESEAWAQELAERADWDVALPDGLDEGAATH